MKTYSLAPVPTCAGIYYLTNKRSGEIYIGQTTGLRRRHSEWKNALSSGYGCTNSIMNEAIQRSPDIDEWFFVVFSEMPGAEPHELVVAEANEIHRMMALLPDKVLNTTLPKTTPTPIAAEGRVILLTDDGGVVGQTIAAKIVGRNIGTIQEKVRWLREQGIMELKVSDLTMDRRKILEKYKSP